MEVRIPKNEEYAQASITVVGLTHVYGRPQYILVNSDGGTNQRLKFPGLQFRAPSQNKTLEDMATERFEEQTGLRIAKSLGLRTILSARSRHTNQWIFRNIFFVAVEDVVPYKRPDGERKVYLADVGHGRKQKEYQVSELMNSRNKIPLEWVIGDNQIVARIATDILRNYDRKNNTTDWYRKIPCVSASPLTERSDRPLGCGLAVSSIMLLYQPSENDSTQIILLQRKGDEYPGYAGGKIETPTSAESLNLNPVSCCSEEGAQEYGFRIEPRALICCACTPLDVSDPTKFYNSIVTYAFVAEPTNPYQVEDALKHPEKYLEGKMEKYVVETLDEHRDRVFRKELRMPDMISAGEQFYASSPGDKIPLTHIRSSGMK